MKYSKNEIRVMAKQFMHNPTSSKALMVVSSLSLICAMKPQEVLDSISMLAV